VGDICAGWPVKPAAGGGFSPEGWPAGQSFVGGMSLHFPPHVHSRTRGNSCRAIPIIDGNVISALNVQSLVRGRMRLPKPLV
jgi:hypothetical protein